MRFANETDGKSWIIMEIDDREMCQVLNWPTEAFFCALIKSERDAVRSPSFHVFRNTVFLLHHV